ncbi:type VII secretion protein EssA [Peribacillus sp. NPDC097675]|uniref:type VII secretion protein EssA n=1 Tax=Peribacillus sp. NPDC097675 TaxID=3390618 RepID=UPI003D086F77
MKWSKQILLLLFIILLFQPVHGLAQEDPIEEPNVYQEKDINIQTEYFHDEELLKQKQKIPEEVKGLTFERGKYDVIDSIEDSLFLSPVTEDNNIIASKAEEMGLFSSEAPIRKRSLEEERSFLKFDLSILLGIVLGIAVLCLFVVLIPRMGKLNQEGDKK